MFEEVQRLRVNRLKKTLEGLRMQYAAMFDEVNAIDGQLRVLRYAEKQVRAYERKKHFLWERFTKRKEYLTYKANLATLQKHSIKMMSLSNRLAHAELEVAEKIKSTDILNNIERLEREVKAAESATNLTELGLTLEQATNLLLLNQLSTTAQDTEQPRLKKLGQHGFATKTKNATSEKEI